MAKVKRFGRYYESFKDLTSKLGVRRAIERGRFKPIVMKAKDLIKKGDKHE